MSRFNSAVLSVFLILPFVGHGHACMAMIPPDPSLTRPPRITTTTAVPTTTPAEVTTTTAPPSTTTTTSSTSSTTTTTSTTTTPLSCKSCPAVKYMAPASCEDGSGSPEVSCDISLMKTVQTPCVAASCPGATMLLFEMEGAAEMPIPDEGIQCRPDGITYESASDPTIFFLATTGVIYCSKDCPFPSPGPNCSATDVTLGKCSQTLGTVIERRCDQPNKLFINDGAVEGSIKCDKGFWHLANGMQLADGFTAYCKVPPP